MSLDSFVKGNDDSDSMVKGNSTDEGALSIVSRALLKLTRRKHGHLIDKLLSGLSRDTDTYNKETYSLSKILEV